MISEKEVNYNEHLESVLCLDGIAIKPVLVANKTASYHFQMYIQ